MSKYYTYERRGIRQDHRAALDEISQVIVKPILAAPSEERKGYAAIVGVIALALGALYIGSYVVGKAKGWW